MLAMAAVGWIRRRVIDANGVTTDLGRRRRCFTGAAREALHLGEHRCAWNGCTISAAFTEADHTDDFRRGGATAPDNGGLLCPHHNRYKNHGYRLTRHPNGSWTTHRPDGTRLGRPPDPPPLNVPSTTRPCLILSGTSIVLDRCDETRPRLFNLAQNSKRSACNS